jgi:hypothetical protein
MIAHSATQIANGTRFRCMFGQIKRREVFYTTQKTSRAGSSRMSIGSGMSIAIVWGWVVSHGGASSAGVRPWKRTGLRGRFDRLPGVVILELRWAEVAER